MVNRTGPPPPTGPIAVQGEGQGARRVLVLSGDVVPFPGLPTSGAGLRAWGIAQGLASAGHDVTLLMPERSLSALTIDPVVAAPLRDWTYDPAAAEAAIARWQPDVIVLQHWWLATHIDPGPIPLVIDLHGPLLLETLYQSHADYEALARQKIAALGRADFVTCAGEFQRTYFYPWLLLAGFDLRDPSIAAVPVSLSPILPPHQPTGDVTFVYGGIYLPWQNPLLALGTLVQRLEDRGQGSLHFFGGPHPVLKLAAAEYEQIERRLAASPRVIAHGLIAHDQLLTAYRQAHVAFDVMARNPERELAFTTRTVEYLWCGLPVVYNDYAELAGLIRAYEAGWCVDPSDAAAIATVVDRVLDDPDEVARRGRNAQRLARERLTWDRTIAPLDAFCRHPVKRRPRSPDLRAVGIRPAALRPIEAMPDALALALDQVEALALQARASADLLPIEAGRRHTLTARAAGQAKQVIKQRLGLDRGLALADYGAVYAGDLAGGVVHAQSFERGDGALYRVDVVFATFGRLNPSRVRLRLHELTEVGIGRELVSQEVAAAELRDNRRHAFVFAPLAPAPGSEVLIQIDSPDADATTTVGLWSVPGHVPLTAQRSVNGQPAPGSLLCWPIEYLPAGGIPTTGEAGSP